MRNVNDAPELGTVPENMATSSDNSPSFTCTATTTSVPHPLLQGKINDENCARRIDSSTQVQSPLPLTESDPTTLVSADNINEGCIIPPESETSKTGSLVKNNKPDICNEEYGDMSNRGSPTQHQSDQVSSSCIDLSSSPTTAESSTTDTSKSQSVRVTDVAKLGGDNHLGPIQHDEFLFLPIGENVGFVGQPIGICEDARSDEIEYEQSSEKTIVSIKDAIEAGSFYDFARHTMTRSKPISLNDGDEVHNVEGSFRCGGQEHFYLETNSTLAVPSESATNLTIYTSTQAVTKTQMYCASCTNTQAAKVVVRMKRMGGGFGGKEDKSQSHQP